jgi:hypothetical protein
LQRVIYAAVPALEIYKMEHDGTGARCASLGNETPAMGFRETAPTLHERLPVEFGGKISFFEQPPPAAQFI